MIPTPAHPLFRDVVGLDTDAVNDNDDFDIDGDNTTLDDGDGLPDRCTLRRRVLLVRPDLNATYEQMDNANGNATT